MRRFLTGLAAVLVAGGLGLALAGEECDKAKCNVGEKISKLLVSWQTAVEAEKAGCADEKAKLSTEIDALSKQCPIGSRMGETIAFVKSALEVAVKSDEACAKACAGKTEAAAGAQPPAEIHQLAAERAKLVKDLHQLASYASGGCEKACASKTVETTAAKSGLCEKKVSEVVASVRADKCEVSAAKTVLASIEGLGCEKKAGEIAAAIRSEACAEKAGEILAKAASEVCASKKTVETAVKTEACAKTCATSDACCKELLSRGQALKASWEKAGSELTSLCPTKRKEMQASFASLQGRSKTLALVPDTLGALAMGVAKVHGINTKMMDWAKANPDVLKSLPAESQEGFKAQAAALAEANEVLVKMTPATTCSAPCTEKKTETTTSVN